jgi:UDP-2,3-diacylglucosamine pyrophosphatase LpxH
MKRLSTLAIVLLLVGSVIFGGCASAVGAAVPADSTPTATVAMTVASNISMSDQANNPPVNNSIQTIKLHFSEPLDATTVSGAVKLYRIDASGNPTEEPCVVANDPNTPASITINNKEVTSFAAGEEYKLVISTGLKSKAGNVLAKEFTGYFATNHSFSLPGNAAANNTRSQIVVVSDIHLGIDDAFTENKQNRQALVDFLTLIRTSPNVKELVIAGDLIDEWFIPMTYVTPSSEAALVDAIAANNQTVVDALNQIIKDGAIKVTYTPGNHDILVTADDMQRICPGINQARDNTQGLGTYVTGANSEIAIEHGHRQNFFCAPDPISNRNITNNNTSVLPPGYFFTRIATSSVVEGHPATSNTFPAITANEKDPSQLGYYLYAKIWQAILSGLPVKESLTDKVIKTNIDGFTQDYAINDLIPQQDPQTGIFDVTLFKGVQDTWDQRQDLAGVKIKIPVAEAIVKSADANFTDSQAKKQFFDLDVSKRIVVFGHTHVVRNLPFTNLEGKPTIYANSGTWIDKNPGFPTMTFVVITPPKSGSAIESVNVYKYSADKTITQWEDPQAITSY